MVAAAGAMAIFGLIKFTLIEIPIAAYAINPAGTASRVSGFSRWMERNKLAGVAAIVGLVGIVLISRGISGLG